MRRPNNAGQVSYPRRTDQGVWAGNLADTEPTAMVQGSREGVRRVEIGQAARVIIEVVLDREAAIGGEIYLVREYFGIFQ